MLTVQSADAAALAFLTPGPPPVYKRDPVPVKARTLDQILPTPHGRVAVWRRGDGPTVLLVHGWQGTHFDLDAFVDPLVEAGRQVISIDLPAHGKSEGKVTSVPEIAKVLLPIEKQIGPISGIIAHSVGCAASALAIRKGLQAPRIVMIAPPARMDYYVRAFAMQFGADPDAVLDALRERGVDADGVDLPMMASSLPSQGLIIHSKDDQVVPFKNGKAIAAAWPNSRFLECEELGHRRILADSQVIAEAVAFLVNESEKPLHAIYQRP